MSHKHIVYWVEVKIVLVGDSNTELYNGDEVAEENN